MYPRRSVAPGRFWNATVAVAAFLVLLTPVLGAAGGRETVPPTTPGHVVVTSSSATSVALKWMASTDDRKLDGYEVSSNGSVVAQPRQASHVLTDLRCGTSYNVAVVAVDHAGNKSSASSAVVATAGCADGESPSAPGNLVQVAKTATSVTLAWSHASDNTAVVGYGVYVDAAAAGSVPQPSHTAANLQCGRTYTLAVDAVDAAGNRSPRTAKAMSTGACSSSTGGDAQPPSTPTGLSVTNATQSAVTLAWSGSTDNVAVTGYDLYVNGQKLATTTSTSRQFTGLQCGTDVALGVEAFDAAGNRSARAAVATRTGSCELSPATGPATLFVSPAGSDAGLCTAAAPCASWGRAYGLAKPGSVVEVAGGRYPSQLLPSRVGLRNLSPGCAPGATVNCVVFRPAAGSVVTIEGKLEVRGSSVWVKGSVTSGAGLPSRARSFNLRVNGYVDTEANSVLDHPDHVIFEGIDAVNFGAFNVDTVTFKNMDVGPATVSSGCAIKEGPGFENKIGWGGGITYVPRNVTLDGLLIHNQNGDAGRVASDCHFGGLFIVTVNGLTIRNSVFSQNVVYNIQVQNFGGSPAPTNVTIENNWFGCSVEWLYVSATTCANQADIQFNAASQFSNWLIRYNSFVGGLGQYVPGASYQNIRVLGNAGSRPSNCYPGWTFAYNAWNGRGCAATDRHLRGLPFRSTRPGREDFRLLPGSRAMTFVKPNARELRLKVDIAGHRRPSQYPRDAGALERDTALLRLGNSIGLAKIGMRRAAVIARYGSPHRSRTVKVGAPWVEGRLDSFAVPGGSLRVTSVGDRVVGLSTRSRYYATSAGSGVGSRTSVRSSTDGGCGRAVRRQIGDVVVSLTTSRDGTVTAVSMIHRDLERPCS